MRQGAAANDSEIERSQIGENFRDSLDMARDNDQENIGMIAAQHGKELRENFLFPGKRAASNDDRGITSDAHRFKQATEIGDS